MSASLQIARVGSLESQQFQTKVDDTVRRSSLSPERQRQNPEEVTAGLGRIRRSAEDRDTLVDMTSTSRSMQYCLPSSRKSEPPAELPFSLEEETLFGLRRPDMLPIPLPVDPEELPITVDDVKPRLTKEQHEVLESHFQQLHRPSTCSKKEISRTLGVPVDKINNWFQNRRAKAKQDLRRTTPKYSNQDIKLINAIISQHALPLHPIEFPQPSYSPSPDWSFLRVDGNLTASDQVSLECPSLTSGSTMSSRNSSTKSAKSFRLYGSDRTCDEDVTTVEMCPFPECTRPPRHVGSHMVVNQQERPERCPIETCLYHTKGFVKASDRLRHINTHFKGTIFCDFCPTPQKASERSVYRPDGLSRHLVSMHGVTLGNLAGGEVQHRAPGKGYHTPAEIQPVATCSLCSEPFDPQGFYDHLPGCVHRQVIRDLRYGSDARPAAKLDKDAPPKGSLGNGSVVTETEDSISRRSSQSDNVQLNFDQHRDPTSRSPAHFERIGLPETSSEPSVPALVRSTDRVGGIRSSERTPSGAEAENDDLHKDQKTQDNSDIAELTASSRSLSLTSSQGIKSSEEETDWTEDPSSPQSEVDAMRALSPVKQKLILQLMAEFHRLFDQPTTASIGNRASKIRAHHGGHGTGSSQGFSSGSSSRGNSSAGSPFMSRKRSLSGGGSSSPNGDKNNGDDPNKRRRADDEPPVKDSHLPERRFACPYYKRNPGRHQTFTSCRDPGFTTVARLKEHLYRRHLLPIQCNRCCTTFANEPTLREHQRDLRGCEIKEQMPLEGFDKDQERRLKSKKRSLVHQSEEDKWKGVYRILFPDDGENMPSPYIEYQVPGTSTPVQPSNVARFQEFSRFELPRLVRRTLEVVVEEEAHPLEEKLKDRLVDIVKECQTQLFSMFQGVGGQLDPTASPSLPVPAPALTQHQQSNTLLDSPFHDFDSSTTIDPASTLSTTQFTALAPASHHSNATTTEYQKPNTSPVDHASDSPDSGYGSATWTAATFPSDMQVLFNDNSYYSSNNEYANLAAYYGDSNSNANLQSGFDPSMWSFVDPMPVTGNSHHDGGR